MRYIGPLLTVVLAGCASTTASDFDYQATFAKETKGLILHEDGESGHAGMFQTNCPFDAMNGQVTGDYDLPGQGEEIQDGEPTELGDITFTAVLGDEVHVVDKTGGVYTHVPVPAPEADQSRLAWDSIVVLDARCTLSNLDLDGQVRYEHQVEGCADSDIEVDPLDATGLYASLEGSAVFGPEGLVPIGLTGDQVAWDAPSGQYYVGTTGQHTLTAVAPDGTTNWTVELPHPLAALDDAGMLQSAAVVMTLPDGKGQIAFFDGAAGDMTASGVTPSPADDLAVSNNGRTLALVRPEQSFIFTLID